MFIEKYCAELQIQIMIMLILKVGAFRDRFEDLDRFEPLNKLDSLSTDLTKSQNKSKPIRIKISHHKIQKKKIFGQSQ